MEWKEITVRANLSKPGASYSGVIDIKGDAYFIKRGSQFFPSELGEGHVIKVYADGGKPGKADRDGMQNTKYEVSDWKATPGTKSNGLAAPKYERASMSVQDQKRAFTTVMLAALFQGGHVEYPNHLAATEAIKFLHRVWDAAYGSNALAQTNAPNGAPRDEDSLAKEAEDEIPY